jgi:hypothetical protein
MESNMKEKKKKNTEYCPNCKRRVRVKGGTGLLQTITGIAMWFFGGAPGARQSKAPQCTICNTEITYI